MATGKSLYKLLNTRWLTSVRANDIHNPTSSSQSDGSNGTASILQISTQNKTGFTDQLMDQLRKFYDLSNESQSPNSVTTSKQSTTNSPTAKKHTITPNYHSQYSSHSYEEAMTMEYESVRQYYEDNGSISAVYRMLPQTTNSNQNNNTADLVKAVTPKQKLAEAKRRQVSQQALRKRMQALTGNLMAKGISLTSRQTRLREVIDHAKSHAHAIHAAREMKVVPFLVDLENILSHRNDKTNNTVKQLLHTAREGLNVMGYARPIKSHGIRVLSIDGGGTRGLVAIETLKQLEIICQKPIHQLFDYICGVSTGGLLAVLVGGLKLSLDQCEAVYKDCSQKIFSRGTLAGAAGLLTRHSFYDMEVWEGILRDELGENRTMLSTAREENSPHLGLISTIMTEVPTNYVFRNYNHGTSSISQYSGNCSAKIWEAIRASSAAPGYFEDFKLGHEIHQDGGVLNNNPTAVAIHEARLLWPNDPLQCVISLGNGRYEPTSTNSLAVSSLRHKVGTFIHSATNTEDVHTVLSDLLDPGSYYRLNPFMSEDYMLNEIQENKLHQMQFETQLYLRRNANKLSHAGQRLSLKRGTVQGIQDWVRDKYSLLPFQL